jgi:anti-sigma B factor antagonist
LIRSPDESVDTSVAAFEYSVAAFSDGHLVTVVGEVDLATAPQLADVLTQFANGTIRVDISGVTFLDSAGMRTLLVVHKNAQRAGRRMIVCGDLEPLVQQTLSITGLDEVLEFDRTA